MPAEPRVRLREVEKRFGARVALRGLSLQVAAGEAVGLVGPNGAGKTTLMRLCVGLSRPERGTVELLGSPPARAALARVGYMAQAEAIYADLSAEENVRFFATLAGLRGEARARGVERALAVTDLAGRRRDRADALSGGMRRRVSLACAIVHDPDVLLLDEPTVGVDPELRAAFWDHFLAMRARGASLLVTTHHLDEAGRCDRLVLIKDGAVLAEGAASDLLARAGASGMEEAFLAFARGRAGGGAGAGAAGTAAAGAPAREARP